MLQVTQKGMKLNARYMILSLFSLGLSVWLFLTIGNGFSWKILALITGAVLFTSFIVRTYTRRFKA
jgi:hypothetical protein